MTSGLARAATPRAARIGLAREALALRGALLPILSGVEAGPAELALLASTSVEGWRLLLTAECCALPLAARLRQAGLARSLPEAVQTALAQAQLAETQRVMAARAQLRELDAIALSIGVELVVIKGGAVVAEPDRPPLDLGDIDLLVTREAAERMWHRLLGDGWREKRLVGGIAATDDEDLTGNHFEPLVPPHDGLAVELHRRARYGGEGDADRELATRPLAGHHALRRTVGAAAFASMLEHSVIQHPHRRGHLRDLFLLADAAAECEPEERARLAVRFEGDRYAPELADMLAMVQAIANGARAVDSWPMRRAVARKYLLVLGDDGRWGARIPGWWELGYLPLERGAVQRARYRELVRSAFTRIPAGSPFAAGGTLRPGQDAGSRLAGAGAWLLRAAYRCGLAATTIAIAPRVRGRVARVTGA